MRSLIARARVLFVFPSVDKSKRKMRKNPTTVQSLLLPVIVLLATSLLILLRLDHVNADEGLRGVIVSCPGCTLNRHQELRWVLFFSCCVISCFVLLLPILTLVCFVC